MGDVMLALARTFASLRDGKVWLYVLTPALFSLLLSICLAVWALGAVVQQMMDYPPMTLLVGWGLVWLANILAYLGGWMAIFAIAYLTASLLAAVVPKELSTSTHLIEPSHSSNSFSICGGTLPVVKRCLWISNT